MATNRSQTLYSAALIVQVAAFVGTIAGFFVALGRSGLGLACGVLAAGIGVIVACSLLRGAIRRETRAQINERIVDDVLGDLTYSDEDWWEATVTVDGRKLGFKIGGDSNPSEDLLVHARDIVASFEAFRNGVLSFLATEASREVRFADEIRALDIEDVCLFWPSRPNDGMIYFRGPDQHRVWRCDYVDRKPTGLGFDS